MRERDILVTVYNEDKNEHVLKIIHQTNTRIYFIE